MKKIRRTKKCILGTKSIGRHLLKEISKTQLVVIVTHEVSLIKKYADSHIKIVDGELVEDGEIEETDLAPATYDKVKEENETHNVLTTFTKSTAKRNGRLFTTKLTVL